MRTVWSKAAMPLIPERYRSLYRYLIPGIDVGVMAFGVSSLLLGSKIVGDFTLPIFLPIWSGLTILGAAVGLASLVLFFEQPRLAWVELSGRIAVDLGLVTYAWFAVAYIAAGNVTTTLTLALVVVRLWASLWRVFDIIGEMVREERKRAAERLKGER